MKSWKLGLIHDQATPHLMQVATLKLPIKPQFCILHVSYCPHFYQVLRFLLCLYNPEVIDMNYFLLLS